MGGTWTWVLAALFLWWFSTGAILCRVRLADRKGGAAHLRSVLYGLPILIGGVWGFFATLTGEGAAAAFGAFLSALAVWGWIELAFLSGIVTGPNNRPMREGAPEWERFIRAWGTIAWHEMLLAAALGLMALAAWEAPNAVAFHTFLVLFLARISAKLNLFYGVPRINLEFLPRTLSHLPSHFRIRPLNWVFPISVTLLAFASAHWLERLSGAEGAGAEAGYALLATLTLLAMLEHWFMILPTPDAKLWRWMLPAPKPTEDARRSEDAHGL